jgi:hypothetical protein
MFVSALLLVSQISKARVNQARQGGFGWDKTDLSPV